MCYHGNYGSHFVSRLAQKEGCWPAQDKGGDRSSEGSSEEERGRGARETEAS